MKRIVAFVVAAALASLVLAPSALAGDQIKDQIKDQLKLQDGSCMTCPCELG